MYSTEDKIDVTDADLEQMVQLAYRYSKPQGMGHLHYTPGDLPNPDLNAILLAGDKDKEFAVAMDYVRGRSCKFYVYKIKGKLYVRNTWLDHTSEDLKTLLSECGIQADVPEFNHVR